MKATSSTDPDPESWIVPIAESFSVGTWGESSTISDIHPLGNGNINDTYLVQVTGDSSGPASHNSAPNPFVLQRINQKVFHYPDRVMHNITQVLDHMDQRLAATPQPQWRVPHLLKTKTEGNYVVTDAGETWRAITYIEHASTHEVIQSADLATEVGRGLGQFHTLVSDLPVQALEETLEGFHITPRYLEQFDDVVVEAQIPLLPEVDYCLNFIRDRRHEAAVLEAAKAAGQLTLRPIHGDPKVNNIMIDDHTGTAVCMIDLDTVKPGLIHYDIGDCLRSACNPLGEETQNFQSVRFDLPLAQAVLMGYCSVAKSFLTSADFDHLYGCIRLLPFELGLRFFTDFLAGNVYFKTDYPEHNLNRALVQFKLAESIEAQASEIQAIVQSLR